MRIRSTRPGVVGFDFRTAPIAGGLYTLPSWLAITCATTGRTSQTGPSTLLTGFGANAARARSPDGVLSGLSVEAAATNRDAVTEDVASWILENGATCPSTDGHAAPDGTMHADKLAWTGTVNSNGTPLAGSASTVPNGTPACASIWALSDGTTTQIDALDGVSVRWGLALPLTAAWARLSAASNAAGAAFGYWGRYAFAAAGAAWLWGTQLEDRLYPSSYIPSPGGGVARAADVLSLPSAAARFASGFFDISLAIRPNFASGEASNNLDILNLSPVRAYLSASSKRIILHTGGVDVQTGVLSWSRDTWHTLRVMHMPGGRLISWDGVDVTGAADSAFTPPATGYLLGNSSGAQECCDLGYVEIQS